MSLTTEWEIKNIQKYAFLLKRINDMEMDLSLLKDDLINLSLCMTPEDIEEAQKLFEKQEEDKINNLMTNNT